MERPRRDAAAPPLPPAARLDAASAFERAMARLTGPQREAVEHAGPALCVVAGAGSGKTSVLTLRAARRIRDGSAAADHTLVCTFTRKAAAELRDRLTSYGVDVSAASANRVPTPGVRAGTVHQLARTLIRRHCLDRGTDVPAIVERSLLLRDLSDRPAAVVVVANEIAWAKARALGPEEYLGAVADSGRTVAMDPEAVADAFRSYQAALHRRRSLDLDDLLVRAADLLAADRAFAERVQWRYRHVAVDEFQDVNPAQYRLVRAVLGDSRDLCVVGDPHQAIYGWNGADPTLLDRLPELVVPLTVLELSENHRSTAQVVDFADAALGAQRAYRSTSLVGEGPAPVVMAYDDERAEADGVAAFLVEQRDGGVRWREQAVLARTHDQLTVISRALSRWAIPHRRGPEPEASGADPGDADRPDERPPGTHELSAGRGTPPPDDAVELTTFHRAKGAQWTSVCVTGLEDGFVPIVHAIDGAARAEERRLLYVALTRAARVLHCSWAGRRTTGGQSVERRPSPWLPSGRGGAPATTLQHAPTRAAPSGAAARVADLRAALFRGR